MIKKKIGPCANHKSPYSNNLIMPSIVYHHYCYLVKIFNVLMNDTSLSIDTENNKTWALQIDGDNLQIREIVVPHKI